MMGPEAKIEHAVTRHAKRLGFDVEKVNTVNSRGRPDRRFSLSGRYFYIEFKAPGQRPTKLQDYVHQQLRERGETVYVVDSVFVGHCFIDIEYAAAIDRRTTAHVA